MTPRRFGLIAAVVFLALMVFAPACAAQSKDDNRVVKVAWLASLYGITVCYEGRGYSFIAANISEIEAADTRAHEAKHREQYTRYKNCQEFDEYYKTPRGKMEIEAEAYAAGYCVAVEKGSDPVSLLQSYAERIEFLVGSINRFEILTTLREHTRHCAFWGKPNGQ